MPFLLISQILKKKVKALSKQTRSEVFHLSTKMSHEDRKDSVFSPAPPRIRQLSTIWRQGTGIVLVCGGEEVWWCCQQSPLWISLRLRRNPFQLKFH